MYGRETEPQAVYDIITDIMDSMKARRTLPAQDAIRGDLPTAKHRRARQHERAGERGTQSL